jgi:hypothetical protein
MFPFVKKFNVTHESETSLPCDKPSNKMSDYRLVVCWYQEVWNTSMRYFAMFSDILSLLKYGTLKIVNFDVAGMWKRVLVTCLIINRIVLLLWGLGKHYTTAFAVSLYQAGYRTSYISYARVMSQAVVYIFFYVHLSASDFVLSRKYWL